MTKRVRRAFPRLVFSRAELVETGDDNLVAVLDGTWIARFPRNEEYRGRFAAELNLLSTLGPISPLPVPRYEQVSDDRSGGVYRLIEGREMTPDVFATMTASEQRAAISTLSSFLSVLHALPEETIRQPDGTIARTWWGAQFAALYRETRRAKIAQVVSPTTLARFDAFHDAFAALAPGPARLTHDDLTDDHILVRGGRFAGNNDLSDATLGDTAVDFAWFWRLGEANVDLLLRDYRFTSQDGGLKERSHWRFVRYMINQLWYGLLGKWYPTPEQTVAELEPHLERLGF